MKVCNTSLLEKESRYIKKLDLTPRNLKSRSKKLSIILSIGISGLILALMLIKLLTPDTESGNMLLSFMALGFLSVSIVTIIAFFVLLWDAFMYQYVLRLEAEQDAVEAVREVRTFANSILAIKANPKKAETVVDSLMSNNELKHLFEI